MTSVLNIHWKNWCCSSNTLATWCKELTLWKRLWFWERLKAGKEGDDKGWDSWMASSTRWTWIWASSGSWRWTGKPGVLQSMGSQSVGHDWVAELNWTPHQRASQVVLVAKNLPANAGGIRDVGSIPGSGRSLREGNANPFQYSCLENPMGGGAWCATVHGVAESWTRLKWQHTRMHPHRNSNILSC